ncbi:hypothetical protein AB0H82_10420 [Streptomyces sp. NPDC050732]|uniref:hypothetical protein n=1 Tax=Streptomyces sp. NPDC050732 TaxID=3154632 RepID=UPI0034169EB4
MAGVPQLAQARREGRFPDLIDTVREIHVPPAWPDAGTFAEGHPAPAADRLARWGGHPGAGGPRLRFSVVRRRCPRPGHRRPRDAVLLVVGDFDRPGEDIERD